MLTPWLDNEPDDEKREAVLVALMSVLEHADELHAGPSLLDHPMKRSFDVPEAGVSLVFLMVKQYHVVQLFRIEPLDW